MKFRYAFLCLVMVTANAFAAAKFERVTGDVRIGTAAVKVGDELANGATVTTGADGLAVMRFDDGHVIAVDRNTVFKIDNYSFDAKQPENSKAFFSMLQGALRSITGMIGAKNKSAFQLKTPLATAGIRGTDFVIAFAENGDLYVGVLEGGVDVGNPANVLKVDAGQFSQTIGKNPSVLVSKAKIPTGLYDRLVGLNLNAAAGVGQGAAAGTTAGVTTGALAASIGALVAGVVAATSSNDNGSSHGSHGTHGTHGK